MRKYVHTLLAREHLARISHSHTFQAGHSTAHILYLFAVASEGISFHSAMGGIMCVCSLIAIIGGETTE